VTFRILVLRAGMSPLPRLAYPYPVLIYTPNRVRFYILVVHAGIPPLPQLIYLCLVMLTLGRVPFGILVVHDSTSLLPQLAYFDRRRCWQYLVLIYSLDRVPFVSL
jgi:hypothetical protein